ncbi:unnamed protein product [Brachionus calyciflorus]|uniref:Cyclic nucleotide-binding domain-containing protein n=2 Tax=Eurotatoria TaxID=2816136 RepID=A0A813PJ10_9BILA|nr:unnamed protein product [Brachionus calyciflorus]
MELSTTFSTVESSNNLYKFNTSPSCLTEQCDNEKRLKSSENCSSHVSINQLMNSSSKVKQLKMYNEELEKHMKRQQSENEFYRHDSFMKKFSTRSHQISENNSTDNNTPASFRRSKKSVANLNHQKSTKNLEELNNLLNKTSSIEEKDPDSNLIPVITSFKKDDKLTHFFNRKNKFSISSSTSSTTSSESTIKKSSLIKFYYHKLMLKCNFFVLSPDDNCMFLWLIILNLCILYNAWLIIARQSFENLQIMFSSYWRIADLISDTIYLLDIFVHFRTGYLEQGLLVYDSKKLALNYVKSSNFWLDIFSLLPLELIQIWYGYSIPFLRFPRFFKVYRTSQLYYITESRTLYPNVWRVANLTHILFLLGHWFAGFYFLISKAEGFKGHWSYPEPIDEFAMLPRMYLRCLYWSTLTLTTIGDLPPPETNWQWLKEMSNFRYLFSIAVHYLAVFVIALIVGQVGNVITNRNANRVEFERLLDGAKQYMRNHSVPTEMQKRVQRWYDYSWSRGRMNGAGDIHSIGLLPDKLKTELALHVNLETLRKVTIFQECQPEFLHDLVLKMRAYIFTPGDMICRKGEVAREMFIIADGVLEVIGESGQVLTKMYSGDFFGEIGILNIEGASNRRTADVRSVGYAELFSLSKEDVLSAVKDYPDAERILIEYGKRRLNHNQNSSSIATSKVNFKTSNDTNSNLSALNLNEENTTFPTIVQSKSDQQIKLKNSQHLDSEVDLAKNLLNEENRGLSTDMLGLPASLKTPNEILLSSLPEIEKITNAEEIIEKELLNELNSKCLDRMILESLNKILETCNLNDDQIDKIDLIQKEILSLKNRVSNTKNAKVKYLQDLFNQKDAKIRLLDSRIRILQKYCNLRDTTKV